MGLFEKYTNEKEFREQFVRPFLNKMGFVSVNELHGTQEFGKDFVFAELTRFGHFRYFAAQVKHVKSIKQGDSLISELEEQTKQAFNVEFRLADTNQPTSVSGVYIINSGDITANACADLRSRLRRSNFGENTFFLDGDRLNDLNNWAGYENDRYLRNRLIGLHHQCTVNSAILRAYIPFYEKKAEGLDPRTLLLHAIESYSSEPSLPENLDISNIYKLMQYAAIISTYHRIPTAHLSEIERGRILEFINLAIQSVQKLQLEIDDALTKLKPL